MKKHYIYAIYHISKKRYYIGETSDYINRISSHMKYGERGYNKFHSSCEKRGLYLAMNKYGITDFMFKVLEVCDIKDKIDREMYWIKKYNAHKDNGYNTFYGIDGDMLDNLIAKNCEDNHITKLAYQFAITNNIHIDFPVKYIDDDLIEHEKIIKQYTRDGEKATNLVVIKEKSSGKIYICRSSAYTEIGVLRRIYNGISIKKNNPMYIHMRKNNINNFKVIFEEVGLSQNIVNSLYIYKWFEKSKYTYDELLFNSQIESFKKIKMYIEEILNRVYA